jgi:hypothetical protein
MSHIDIVYVPCWLCLEIVAVLEFTKQLGQFEVILTVHRR